MLAKPPLFKVIAPQRLTVNIDSYYRYIAIWLVSQCRVTLTQLLLRYAARKSLDFMLPLPVVHATARLVVHDEFATIPLLTELACQQAGGLLLGRSSLLIILQAG